MNSVIGTFVGLVMSIYIFFFLFYDKTDEACSSCSSRLSNIHESRDVHNERTIGELKQVGMLLHFSTAFRLVDTQACFRS